MSLDPNSPYALVVEDDVWIRMDAAGILEEFGFRCFEAGHVDEAMLLIDENHALITLLFTDVHMPGSHDGFWLARTAAERFPHIAIVVASGIREPAAHDLPAKATFIRKPFSADMIKHHLQRILPDGQKPKPLKAGR